MDVKYYINVGPGLVAMAVEFYCQVLGAQREETLTDGSVELRLHGSSFLVTGSASNIPTVVEILTDSQDSQIIRANSYLGLVENDLSLLEIERGVTAKWVDPFMVTWLITNQKASTQHLKACKLCCGSPPHFPVLCSEMKIWNDLWGAQPNGLSEGVRMAQMRVRDLLEELSQIRITRNAYEAKDIEAFGRHPSLSFMLNELENMNGYLQGVTILEAFYPSYSNWDNVTHLAALVEKSYLEIRTEIDGIPPANIWNWPNLSGQRKLAADRTRQLVKATQKARDTMHRKHTENIQKINPQYERDDTEEEKLTRKLIYDSVPEWRKQNLT